MEEAEDVHAEDGSEVRLGVAGEGLGDENAGVVDERVDAPEPRQTFGDRALRRFAARDVARDGENIGVA